MLRRNPAMPVMVVLSLMHLDDTVDLIGKNGSCITCWLAFALVRYKVRRLRASLSSPSLYDVDIRVRFFMHNESYSLFLS